MWRCFRAGVAREAVKLFLGQLHELCVAKPEEAVKLFVGQLYELCVAKPGGASGGVIGADVAAEGTPGRRR